MDSSERSPKRQRSSLSPASPPYHQFKGDLQTKQAALPPQTPTSPSRLSNANHGSPRTYSQTFPTPPHTAGLSSHMPNSSAVHPDSTQTSQDTPLLMTLSRDGDQDIQMTEQMDAVAGEGQERSRSDHDRQETAGEAMMEGVQSVMDSIPLLCELPHPLSAPHPSDNLVALYDIDDIAASVARRDPLTGEKINKLRKSYEGKVKNQGLPGRNKPTDIPGELLGFMEWPEEGWYDQRVYGRDLTEALRAPMMTKLERALSMQAGRLPAQEYEKWKNVLGVDEGSAARNTPVIGPVQNAAQTVLQRLQPTSMRASAPASPRGTGLRPDRSGKKRRYDDASFEGYEYQEDDGYSTGGIDDRRNSAGRKRRKEFSSHDSAGFDSPSSHFSSSMVGVKIS